jgi:LysR family hydrogen peroxide-inducible transcriptional activator
MSKVNFSLTQIEYALAVFKTGHFAKAAELCGVTQPTLSMQIKKLEDELGVVLFDRTKKPILLTQAGQTVMEQLQTLLFEAQKVEGLIAKSTSAAVAGELRLGVIPTIAPYLLPRLLLQLSSEKSRIELSIKEMQTQKIIEALDADEIDVGCLATPLDLPKVIEFPLFYEPFYVLCNDNHSLARSKRLKNSQLKSHDLWLLEDGHCFRNQILDVCSLGRGPERGPFSFQSGSLETIKKIISTFGGFTLIPAMAEENLPSNVKVIPFEKPIPSRQVGLVYQRAHYKIDLIEALGDIIIRSLPDEIRKLRPRDLEVVPVD